jgi:hypothetical protein
VSRLDEEYQKWLEEQEEKFNNNEPKKRKKELVQKDKKPD